MATSTCTTSPETSAAEARTLAGSILPRTAITQAQRVTQCHTNVIIPRNPTSVVMVCVRFRYIRAVGIYADIVGAASVVIPVSVLDSPILEVGRTAVSA